MPSTGPARPRLLLTVLVVCTLPPPYPLPPASALLQPMASRPPAVLIVGSGISGLAAAHKLHARGFQNVRVLEATGRTGGRIRSRRYGKGFIEIGAQWIHGPSPGNPVFRLASEYSLLGPDALTKENQEVDVGGHPPPFSVSYGSSGKKISPEVVGNVMEMYSSWLEQTRNFTHTGCDPKASVGGFIQREIALRAKEWDSGAAGTTLALLSGLLKLECCISGTHSMDDVALCPFGEYTVLPGLDCTFPGGYESLVNQIKSTLPDDSILLNKAVKTVHWNGSYQNGSYQTHNSRSFPVMVECEDGETFVADHVIVTVPLGFLKERTASFLSPKLPPNKVKAIQNMGFGTNNKVFLEFKEPFWEPDCEIIQLVWEGESPLKESPKNLKQDWVKKFAGFVVLQPPELVGHVLCGFIAGEESEYMETLTDEDILSAMTAVLRQFTGNPQLPPPVRMLRTRWRSEPYTRGSYSYVAVGSSGEDVDILARPLPLEEDTSKPLQVLFAGEATHRNFYSTTHGALLSGWREADRLTRHYPELVRPLNRSKL
ncbi:peroxisomal N(1)-acetyl-spermine/spermidine oxidase-like [Spea bombifrons]|uniref:peroxisomal N(1)-acetyl-spermine/spermidine oxidase-like n=1 Tax=Spea bombifrons TaxID=233779 RepID=UPI00234929DB|nr:peroxisomal N(1)-acetyl-spermine/spermidine oxidase-like [Spea bombifrons]